MKRILKWTGFDRYNLRSNVTSNPTDWLEIGERVGITYSESYGNQGNHAEDAVVSWCYRMPPIVPVYDIMGNYAGTRAPGTGNAQNPIFLLDKNQWDKRKRMNVSGNAYAQINLLEGLSARTTFGFYHNSYFTEISIMLRKLLKEESMIIWAKVPIIRCNGIGQIR